MNFTFTTTFSLAFTLQEENLIHPYNPPCPTSNDTNNKLDLLVCLSQYCSPCVVNGVNGKVVVIVVVAVAVVVVYK